MTKNLIIVFLLFFISEVSLAHHYLLATKSAKGETPNWSASMRSLQKNLTDLEPFLFNLKDYNDPSKQTFIKEKLAALAKESKNIGHNPTMIDRDPTVRFVASQFASDLERASLSFNEGKTEFARYQVMKVASACIQCHTRMQQGPAFNFSKSESFFNLMPPADQAEYLIASRRFDQAYDILIKQLEQEGPAKPNVWQAERMVGLALTIAVQYQQNIKNTEKLMTVLQKNKSTAVPIRDRMSGWKKSIDKWKGESTKVLSLDDYQKILKSKSSEIDAMRIIPGILSILSEKLSQEKLGQGLLLAGEAYEVLAPLFPMELHENYYESCVRNVPHTAMAKKCFMKLQDSIRSGYSGSRGVNIPLDIEVWLNNLNKLAESN